MFWSCHLCSLECLSSLFSFKTLQGLPLALNLECIVRLPLSSGPGSPLFTSLTLRLNSAPWTSQEVTCVYLLLNCKLPPWVQGSRWLQISIYCNTQHKAYIPHIRFVVECLLNAWRNEGRLMCFDMNNLFFEIWVIVAIIKLLFSSAFWIPVHPLQSHGNEKWVG